MDSGVGITLGRPGRGSGSNSTSVLVLGILMIGGAIFAFAVSASTRNSDPTDFFYNTDNEASTMFAVFGAISFIVGLVLIGLSIKVKEDERRKQESQARAYAEARERNIQDIANAVKSNIKVRCRYCGMLNEEGALKCSSCGAAL